MTAEPSGAMRFLSACTIPTHYGVVELRCYGTHELDPKPWVAWCSGELQGRSGVHMRVHDACATSELFASEKCDCAEQLRLAQQRIASSGGVLIYTPQEGRGIGLAQKIAAYALQENEGLDTVDANRALGLPDENRSYEAVPLILSDLGVRSVRILTNNPFKVGTLTPLLMAVGIGLERVSHWASTVSERCQGYLDAKVQRMGHMATEEAPALDAAIDGACAPCEECDEESTAGEGGGSEVGVCPPALGEIRLMKSSSSLGSEAACGAAAAEIAGLRGSLAAPVA